MKLSGLAKWISSSVPGPNFDLRRQCGPQRTNFKESNTEETDAKKSTNIPSSNNAIANCIILHVFQNWCLNIHKSWRPMGLFASYNLAPDWSTTLPAFKHYKNKLPCIIIFVIYVIFKCYQHQGSSMIFLNIQWTTYWKCCSLFTALIKYQWCFDRCWFPNG